MNRETKSYLGVVFETLVVFLLVLDTAVQSQILDFPTIEVVVIMDRGTVRFEFFEKRPDSPSSRVPVKVYKLLLDLPSGGPTLWRIISPDGSGATNTIVYGVVPPGFSQTVPTSENPPPLTHKQRYVVNVEGEGVGRSSFIYIGNDKDSGK